MKIKYDDQFGKKHNNLYTVMGIIADILFYPIIIFSLLCCFVIYIDKSDNKIPSIFGLSLVSISSTSMEKGGFEVQDIVFLKKTDASDLRAGDIIAFYFYKDKADDHITSGTAILVQSYDRDEETSTPYNVPESTSEKNSERASINEVSGMKRANVYFHRIIDVYADESGTLFFQTQGDSNSGKDSLLICEDYVAGVYSYTPEFIRGIFKFIASTTGIIILVVVPLSILILFMSFSIIEQIYNILIERKVLRREIRYDSKEVVEASIGAEMDILDKIQFFAQSPPEERQKVAQFLWGFLKFGNKKEEKEYGKISYLTEIFEENPKHFWLYWIGNTRSNNKKRKIERIWQNWDIEKTVSKKISKKTKPKGLK